MAHYTIKRGPKTCNAPRKKEAIFKAYERMIQEEGEKARLFPKAYFYERLADEFFLTSTTISIYVPQMCKKKTGGQR